MSRSYRYKFTKEVFPEYIVFIVVKREYVTYKDDLEILRYIKYKDKLKILDNLDIIIKKDFKINNSYNRYLYLVNINKIINKLGSNLVKTSLL